MHHLLRFGILATLATAAVGVSGCKSSDASSGAKATTAAAGASSRAAGSSSAGTSSGGSTNNAGATGAVKDPCLVVTASDVSTVMGATVPPSTSLFTGVYQACSYATPENSAGQSTVVIVTDRLIDKAGFEASVKQNSGQPSPLAGVCQDAFVSGSNVLGWTNGTEVDSRISGMPAGGDAVAAGTKLVTGACAKL